MEFAQLPISIMNTNNHLVEREYLVLYVLDNS